MNAQLDPRTDIAIPSKPAVCGSYIPGLCSKEALMRMGVAARRAFNIPSDAQFGFVCAKDDRIFFQVSGDRTPYSIAVTQDHLPALSYVVLRKRAAKAFLPVIDGRVYS